MGIRDVMGGYWERRKAKRVTKKIKSEVSPWEEEGVVFGKGGSFTSKRWMENKERVEKEKRAKSDEEKAIRRAKRHERFEYYKGSVSSVPKGRKGKMPGSARKPSGTGTPRFMDWESVW